MNEEFVTYKQALALKELGFNERCIAADYYENGDICIEYAKEGITNKEFDKLTKQCNKDAAENGEDPIPYEPTIPLKQQAFRWFREKHELGHMINGIGYEAFCMGVGGVSAYFSPFKFKTYEEAEQACLDKLIEICKANGRKSN
jgi:hypothetical protein